MVHTKSSQERELSLYFRSPIRRYRPLVTFELKHRTMAYAIRTVSPGTGDVIFEHVGITLDDARDIVDRSQAAFLSYRDLRFDKRKSIIVGALDTLDRMKAQLADELTLQMGRPITYAPAEIDTMRKRADYLIQAASGALADLPGKPEPGFKRWISKEPVGPVFIVSAWNVSRPSSTKTYRLTTWFNGSSLISSQSTHCCRHFWQGTPWS